MAKPERVFLDWSRPTAGEVARWLAGRTAGALVLTPTQESGRRLRWELRDTPPRAIFTPAQFLEPRDAADPLVAALALAEVLASPRAARCRALFPAGVPARNFAERLALARQIRNAQAEVAEHDLSMGDAAARFAPGSLEAARWQDLARLVAEADDRLAQSGSPSRESARIAALRDPRLPAGVTHVVVAAIVDLQPIIAHALAHLAAPVTVLVVGPKAEDAFDEWGRPVAEYWNDRDPGWRDFDAQVHVVASPESLRVSFGDDLEIGLLDRELLPALEECATLAGRTIHDPTGRPLSAHWLSRTLAAFAALVAEPSFPRAADLLRNGAVRAWLESRLENPDLEAALAAADRIRARHFPGTLAAALPWVRREPALHAALGAIEAVVADLRRDPAPAARSLADELATAFPDEHTAAVIEEIDRLATQRAALSAVEWLHMLQEALALERLHEPRARHAVDALGWLELPWSESRRLLLAGMNRGRVPAPLGGICFLGESSRAALGLPAAEQRRARDAWFLARLLALPREVEVLVLKTDSEGSPLDPSPLLFAGADRALPERVDRLFGEVPAAEPDPAWAAGWLLDPPVLDTPRTIAVTDFQRYLDCPFTFYLARVARMENFDPAADELDAAQFGDLVHVALQGWAQDASSRDATDAALITRALHSHVDDWVARNLGRRLSLPLRLQVESARARLAAFAGWQAADRRSGWRIEGIEQSFAEILGSPWEVDGFVISGRIDRIDRHEHDGRWRVIDYKTFDSADGPERKHLRAFRAAVREWPPAYALVPQGNRWWINLQLPLYRELLLESGKPEVLCGYFNLPKTIAEAALQTWDTLDDALQKSAVDCARGVLADISARRFWPPNARAAYSEFAELLAPEAARVLDPQGAFRRSCAS
jgi:ATP-dependent helicase/nuclease subunit B